MKPFNHEELTFLKGLNQRGRATTPEAEKMLKICQRLIGPEYRFCTDCSDIIAGKYRMMMENAEKQINMQIRHYRPPVNTSKYEDEYMEKKRKQFGEDLKRQENYYSTKPEEVTPKHPRKDFDHANDQMLTDHARNIYDDHECPITTIEGNIDGSVNINKVDIEYPKARIIKMKNTAIKKAVDDAFDGSPPFDIKERSRQQIIDDAFELLKYAQIERIQKEIQDA